MKTLIANLVMGLLGLLAAFGVHLDVSAETVAQLAGGVAAAAAIANQVVHYLRDRNQEPKP